MGIRPPSITQLYSLVVGVWLVVASPLWVNQLAVSLKGDWVDAAVSDVLSEKYGSPITVRGVHFERWHALHFGAFTIHSETGNPLVEGSGGTLRLRRLDLSAKGASETEIRFKDMSFTKEYYANSRTAGTWKFLLRKPIHVKELCFLVKQSRSGTKVIVTDCLSEGVRITGGIEVAYSGAFRNNLQISVSPWTALRSML